MHVNVQISVNQSLYLRDPEATELGRKIVSDGIELIHELGFQDFTFKKLAERINSTEASVYRYFRSKQHLLQYLVAWYWHWLEYVIEIKNNNVSDPKKRLDNAIDALVESDINDPSTTHVNEATLFKIIIAESARVYLTKQEHKVKGKDLFEGYDHLCSLLTKYISEINPKYKHATALATTIISTVHQQVFFCEQCPNSPRYKGEKGDRSVITKFVRHLILTSLA